MAKKSLSQSELIQELLNLISDEKLANLEFLCSEVSPSVKKQLKNHIINRNLLPLRKLAEKCNSVGGAR
jgi:hypothetical protein